MEMAMKDAHALSLETSLGVAASCSPLPLCRRKGPGKEVRECVMPMLMYSWPMLMYSWLSQLRTVQGPGEL